MDKLSWRVKLMGLFTLILGTSLLFQLFYVIPTVQDREVKLTKTYQENIARNIARELDIDLKRFESGLTMMAKQSVFRTMDIANQHQVLVENVETSPLGSSFFVMDAEGWFVSGSVSEENFSAYTTKSYADEPYFTVPFEQGQVYFGMPLFYPQMGLVGTSVSVPIESDTGERVGVLIGGMILNDLMERVADYPLDEGSVAYLVDREGTVVAHSGIDLFALEEDPLSLDYSEWPMVQAVMAGEMGGSQEYEHDDTSYFGTYAILESNGWGVVVGRSMGSILAESDALAGQLLWVNSALFASALAVTLVFAGQITAEHKRTDEALRVSEERFALAVRGSDAGLWDWDILNNSLYWSSRLKELLGYADDELDVDFDTFDSLLHPDDREHTGAAIEAHLKDRGLYDVEQRLRTKSGEYRWFRARGQALWDEAGNPVRMVGSTADIAERKRAEERVEHLNLVLRAIRNVNQLIAKERGRDRLLQGVCDNLIETRGYHNAWIALLDETGRLVATAEAGWGEEFTPMVERLKHGELTTCGQRALTQLGVVVTEDPPSTCAGCPLSANYAGRGAMTVRLEHGGEVYGLLSTSIPSHLTANEEEQALFEEVAADITFALHDIELEEERKRAEEEAQRRAAQAALTYEVGQRVSSKLERDELLSEIVTAVRDAFDYYGVMILLVDEEAKRLIMQSIAGGYADVFPRDLCHAIGEGMTGYAAASGETQVSGDVSKDPHYVREAEEETKSELAVPIKSGEKVIGVLDLQSDEFDAFDETDVMVMETLADQIAIAIENACLYEEIEERRMYLEGVLGAAPDAIVTLDARHRVVEWNAGAERLFGYSPEEVIGQDIDDLITSPEVLEEAVGFTQMAMGGREVPPTEAVRYRKDGSPVDVLLAGSPIMVGDELIGAVAVYTDITARVRMEETLRTMALLDELTGLYNRRGFSILAEQQLKMADRTKTRMMLLFADFNGLKRINDTFGHSEGDRALIETANALTETFRESDIVARVGGDEFVVLAIETNRTPAEILATRLQENLEARNARGDRRYELSLSVGLAHYDLEHPCSIDELVAQADRVMYERKRGNQES